MIITGMALNTNGLWEERQFFPNLQNIINKYRNHFNGEEFVEASTQGDSTDDDNDTSTTADERTEN